MKKIKCILKILFVAALLAWYLTIGCPIKWITGVSCPGCGMTRAFFSFIRGNFKEAWHFHPLIFFFPLAIIPYFLRKKLSKKEKYIIIFIFVLAFTVVFFVRLFGKSDIVCADSANSVIYRVFEEIKTKWRS